VLASPRASDAASLPHLNPENHDFQTSPTDRWREESPARAQGQTEERPTANLANSASGPHVWATRAPPWPHCDRAGLTTAPGPAAGAAASKADADGPLDAERELSSRQSLRAGGLWFMREYEKGDGSWWVKPPVIPPNIIISPLRGVFKYTQSWTLAEKLYDHLIDYNLGEITGAGRQGNPIDSDLLHVGDVIFLDFDNHAGRWDHSQFVSGRDARGEFVLAQHSGAYELPLSTVNARIAKAHHGAWGWAIVHPIHTRADLDFGIT
jgi:hypothetical protein